MLCQAKWSDSYLRLGLTCSRARALCFSRRSWRYAAYSFEALHLIDIQGAAAATVVERLALAIYRHPSFYASAERAMHDALQKSVKQIFSAPPWHPSLSASLAQQAEACGSFQRVADSSQRCCQRPLSCGHTQAGVALLCTSSRAFGNVSSVRRRTRPRIEDGSTTETPPLHVDIVGLFAQSVVYIIALHTSRRERLVNFRGLPFTLAFCTTREWHEQRRVGAAMEFKGIDLGDKRLNQRAVLLAEQLSGNPTASIPQACGGWAETGAAYRFFAQDKLEWTDVMERHWQCSAERMRACDVVLCLDDTTELNFNVRTSRGWGRCRMKPSAACTFTRPTRSRRSGEPLGVLNAWMWARERKGADGVRGARRKARAGLKDTNEWPSRRRICPARCWCTLRTGVGHHLADAPGARSRLSGGLADSRPAQSRVARGSKALGITPRKLSRSVKSVSRCLVASGRRRGKFISKYGVDGSICRCPGRWGVDQLPGPRAR